MSPQDLEQALAIPEDHPVWQAVMSYLVDLREGQWRDAAIANGQEKECAAKAAIGAGDILSTAIANLEDIRRSSWAKSNA